MFEVIQTLVLQHNPSLPPRLLGTTCGRAALRKRRERGGDRERSRSREREVERERSRRRGKKEKTWKKVDANRAAGM